MKTPNKKEYTNSESEEKKSRYESLIDQGMDKDKAWRMAFEEPDSNQPYENWPKAELEGMAAKQGIENPESMSKADLIAALTHP